MTSMTRMTRVMEKKENDGDLRGGYLPLTTRPPSQWPPPPLLLIFKLEWGGRSVDEKKIGKVVRIDFAGSIFSEELLVFAIMFNL